MRQNSELRRYMKAISEESAERLGRHLSRDELIAYWQSEMTAPEREAAQTHLLRCDQCLAIFRDVNDFFEPRRGDETGVNEFEAHRAWRDLRRRLHNAEVIAAPPAQSSTSRPRFNLRLASAITESIRRIALSGAAWPLAAGLLITLGLATVFVWRERQEKQQAQQQLALLQNRQRDIEDRLRQIEQTAGSQLKQEREQRTQAEARAQAFQTQLNELQQAQQNVPIYSRLLSSEKGEGDDWQLSVPSTAKTFWLSLSRAKPYEFPEYSIRLLDQRGRMVVERHGLRPVSSGYLSFALSRSELQAGKYNLLLYGHRGKTKQNLGGYELTLSFPH